VLLNGSVKGVGLAIERSWVQLLAGLLPGKLRLWVSCSHTCPSDTKHCNLVPAKSDDVLRLER